VTAFLSASERFLGLDDVQAEPATVGVVVLPVPFERTSSYGHGSAAGPGAVLRASHEVELYDTELGFEPWAAAGGVATLRPLAFADDADGAAVADALDAAVTHWRSQGKRVVTLAGEHTGIVGAVRAHARASGDFTVLQLDAHSDLREAYHDDPWNHACAMARVLDFHDDLVQVGIRSACPEDNVLAEDRGVRTVRAVTVHDDAEAGRDWIGPILAACRDRVYVTLDCDVFDPAVMPATGTPEPGGLNWRQMNALLERLCRAKRVIGFDVCELAPIAGVHHPEFSVAKLIARFMGWMEGAGPRGAPV
jgi:agmatinase